MKVTLTKTCKDRERQAKTSKESQRQAKTWKVSFGSLKLFIEAGCNWYIFQNTQRFPALASHIDPCRTCNIAIFLHLYLDIITSGLKHRYTLKAYLERHLLFWLLPNHI